MISYHDVREVSSCKARELVRKVLVRNHGNVSHTARVLGISRQTVRRARDGGLDDLSRRPHHCPRKTPDEFECLIVAEGKRTGFRYRRLSSYLQRKYGLMFSEDTVRAILRRNQVKRHTRRAATGHVRHLYDYEALIPFRELQLDTKHLLDKGALAPEVYAHMNQYGLPRFEWHIMDAATRARFTAYSYELSATFGFLFIVFVLVWLRAHGVRDPVRIRLDNGAEFCAGSVKKLAQWNQRLGPLEAVLDPIPAGAKHLLALVENAHRTDDEYFLMIHAERCLHTLAFLTKAQQWQDTWNFYRPHFGLGMKGYTPKDKLKATKTMLHQHIMLFPVLLLETLLKQIGNINQFLNQLLGGKYVYTTCRAP
jgi:putative transposase